MINTGLSTLLRCTGRPCPPPATASVTVFHPDGVHTHFLGRAKVTGALPYCS